MKTKNIKILVCIICLLSMLITVCSMVGCELYPPILQESTETTEVKTENTTNEDNQTDGQSSSTSQTTESNDTTEANETSESNETTGSQETTKSTETVDATDFSDTTENANTSDTTEITEATETTETEDTTDTNSVTTEDYTKESEETTEEIETEHKHSYSNNCDKYCNGCGEYRTVGDHVYTNDCDPTCNECNKYRMTYGHKYDSDSKCTTVTCENCGYMNHQEHNYERVNYTPATLLSGGYEYIACTKCGDFKSESNLDQLTLDDFDMPVVYITDFADTPVPLKDLQKDPTKNPGEVEEINIRFKYVSNSDDIESFECTAEIKIQGATSAGFPKKNFTVKFLKDNGKKKKVDLGWGEQSKYCMKANWVDFSHARNIIGAKMFAEVAASRSNLNEDLLAAPNMGAIDGFPILVFLNGEFHGLYTMNIPKDSWMFGMDGDETTKEALLMADQWSDSIRLKQEIGDGAFEDYGWEVEYASTEDLENGTDWIKDSMNALIRLLNCGDNERIKAELHNHLDIEAAIDNMLYTYFINAADNVAKNILWATYDGEIWIPSVYDMDGTFGMYWNGEPTTNNTYPSINGNGTFNIPGNQMYRVLIECFPDEVEARWMYLRQDILTLENTKSYFDDFYAKAPIGAYDSDRAKWLGSGGWTEPFYYDNHTNYYKATKDQLIRLDKFFYNFNK